MFEHITASEVAGYGVGALLLCATISAPKIDSLIAASQRSSIGMCKRCGDLRLIACSRCKGSGIVEEQGLFNLNLIGGDYNSSRIIKPKEKSMPCVKCRARGHFYCPACSEVPNI